MRSRWRDPRVWFGLLVTALCGLLPMLLVWALIDTPGLRLWLSFGIALLTASALYAAWRFAPWYPTRSRDLARIARLSQLTEGQTFYDLGCGDGRVVAYLSQQTQARCVGIELSYLHFFAAMLRQLLVRRTNLYIQQGDMFRVPLHDADVVYLYGIKQTIQRAHLAALLRKLKPGARLLSYDYPLDGLTPNTIDRAEGGLDIYVYEQGVWSPTRDGE